MSVRYTATTNATNTETSGGNDKSRLHAVLATGLNKSKECSVDAAINSIVHEMGAAGRIRHYLRR